METTKQEATEQETEEQETQEQGSGNFWWGVAVGVIGTLLIGLLVGIAN